MDLLQRLAEYRRQEQELSWEGSFLEYLELIKQNPKIAWPAHSRVYDMIISAGVERENGIKKYKFFAEEIFGLDQTIERLVEDYFHAAAKRLDVRKRILLLMGPVSGGKSTIVNLLKRGLEAYSHQAGGAVYAIQGCPMHEEPLHLVPLVMRQEFLKEYGVQIEGGLCPSCRMMLEERYCGQLEKVKVERIFFSEENRIGIGSFSPSDPKSQDIADLTGSIDFSTITEYGSESDPRAYRFDGELNKANRGLMEFQEILKCDEKFLYHLLSLSQEGNFKAGRYALISADELIIGHTNEAEYRSFISNSKNEALRSRILVLPVPYNLKVSEEERIYEKLIRQSDLTIHLAPYALRAAAVFSVLSRLKQTRKQGLDLVQKMQLYNGEEVEGFKQKDLEELQAEIPGEGMTGIDPRFVFNRIASALINKETACVNALDILRAIKDGLDSHPSLNKDDKSHLLNLLALARQEYDEFSKKEIQKAMINSFDQEAEILFENYLDHIQMFCNQAKMTDPLNLETLEPNETLMRDIEEQIGVSENAKRSFREEILIRLATFARQGKKFNYRTHQGLKQAIEQKLFTDLKDLIKLTNVGKSTGSHHLQQLEGITKRLQEMQGYCPECARELIQYAGNLLHC